MDVKVTFLGDEKKIKPGAEAPAALVPQTAVREDGGKKVVFLVKNDHVERRAVTLGGNRGSDTEVIAGLNVGDTVVVNGPPDLRDGQAVQIKR
jgi:multidrug efflux pump subunit AcrA (membrane-fusion protein)